MGIFGKDKKQEKQKPAQIEPAVKERGNDVSIQDSTAKFLPTSHGILKGFYVSEKASMLNLVNQYTFKVFNNATKNEIKKQVEKSFDVKVRDVKIVNLPRKTRNVGRHSGFKSGFKKAIVALKEGYSINQAKA